jgi:predicted lipoprotein
MLAGKEPYDKFSTHRKNNKTMPPKTVLRPLAWIVVLVGLLAALWIFGFTVVPIHEVQQVEASQTFDPVKYVDGIWGSKIVPTIMSKSVDLSTILNAMHPNENGHVKKDQVIPIANEYGLITEGEAQVYMVKGTGQVVNMDTSSNTGTMDIQLQGYSGPISVQLYMGPIIPADNTSIRDSVGFINFGDFQDQTQYGKVASEINKRVAKDVLGPLREKDLRGKTVSFAGAFTIRTFNLVVIDMSQIQIVPIMVTVEN